jgi:hypothetical protein
MEKIYSKIQSDKLLHIINRFNEITERSDVIPDTEFIQCATLKMQSGKTFKPHKHIEKERSYKNKIAQESWVIIKGKVRCTFYDIDDSIIAQPILEAGDASFTLYGGHTYEILEDDTIVYEYKTGPYEGQALDKIFI